MEKLMSLNDPKSTEEMLTAAYITADVNATVTRLLVALLGKADPQILTDLKALVEEHVHLADSDPSESGAYRAAQLHRLIAN